MFPAAMAIQKIIGAAGAGLEAAGEQVTPILPPSSPAQAAPAQFNMQNALKDKKNKMLFEQMQQQMGGTTPPPDLNALNAAKVM